ncbi:MAG TPA: hypothetical protein VEK06_02150, partial [Myxococcota bacterium]|nr:hypothetical protein [Myxococcota bacterium]
MTDGGANCWKPSYVEKPITPSCDAGHDYDAGLCYKKCDVGYYGVGPVCWGSCPKGMTDCGAMCGDSGLSCAMAIGDMVLSVGQVIMDAAALIGSLGTSVAAQGGIAAAKASMTAALKSAAKKAAENLVTNLPTFAQKTFAQKKEVVKTDFNKKYPGMDPQLADELTKMIASEAEAPEKFDYGPLVDLAISVDPTGIASAVKSFVHEICEVGPPPAPGSPPPFPPVETEAQRLKFFGEKGKQEVDLFLTPNFCNFMLSRPLARIYKDMPISKWEKRTESELYTVFQQTNPIRRSVFDALSNTEKQALLKMNCDLMRSDPAFLKLANSNEAASFKRPSYSWPTWTDAQREEAIKIVQKGTNLSLPVVQKFNNFELLGFLRAH